MVFQRPVMLRRSAIANVEYALGLAGVFADAERGAARERRSRASASRTGRAVRARPVRRRTAAARARARVGAAPEVLFLDEPTASLDPGASAEVERIIQAIRGAGRRS